MTARIDPLAPGRPVRVHRPSRPRPGRRRDRWHNRRGVIVARPGPADTGLIVGHVVLFYPFDLVWVRLDPEPDGRPAQLYPFPPRQLRPARRRARLGVFDGA
jgi:hypothetical protein